MREVTLSAINLKEFPNKPMTAYYIGTRTIDTNFGESAVHDFQKEDGKRISVYGFTSLNNKLNLVQPGLLCQITYTGTEKIKTKYGIKDVHQCTVFVDDKKKIELSKMPEPVISGNGHEPVAQNDDLPF